MTLERLDKATTYSAGRVSIRIGVCPQIDADTWAFMTAWNPLSLLLSADENATRQAKLEADLAPRQWESGHGIADGGDWPPEASCLVFDMSEVEAVALARKYGQAAIVFGERGQPARLIWVMTSAENATDLMQKSEKSAKLNDSLTVREFTRNS